LCITRAETSTRERFGHRVALPVEKRDTVAFFPCCGMLRVRHGGDDWSSNR
jgi:hypothetical protein